jgi:membrane peptidoglycan carboxypeptidase
MREPEHRPARTVAMLALVGLLAGVIVAAAVFPLAAASGLAAKASAQSFDQLPPDFTVVQAPQATQVFAADGKTLVATFFDENRRDVDLAEVSPLMTKALVAAEDKNFYRHNGVDMGGLIRAAVVNQASGTQQGGSTLTMQLVRMLATYSATDPQQVIDATEKNAARKLREAKQAIALDRKLGKDGVLERYLNMAPFGHSTYGVYAASQFYFGTQPKRLDLAQAALLAAIIRGPGDYDPLDVTKRQAALDRRNWVLDKMVTTKAITQAEATAAKAEALKITGRAPSNGCTAAKPNDWGFFCDYFRRWWLDQEAFGNTAYDRERRLDGGGYRVVTTLDPKVQAAARKRVGEQIGTGAKNAIMLAAVEPGTGRVRALATNRVFGVDDPAHPRNKPHSDPAKAAEGVRGTYPVTSNPLMTGGGGVTGYQAGSTFKMFTMVAALEKGYPLSYPIDAPKVYRSGFPAPQGAPGSCTDIPRYCPTNDSPGMAGPADMWSAFGRSVNTYFVPLEERVGVPAVIDAAKRLGVEFLSPQDRAHADDPDAAASWGAFTLGVTAITPLDLADAYATLAADGMHCAPTPVQEIVEESGQKLDVAGPRCDRAVTPEVARAAIDAARCPVGDQSAFGKCHGSTAGGVAGVVAHPVAGKTGTTDSHRTASLVVTTRQLAVAGIMGDPDWPGATVDTSHNVVNPAVYETLADAMKGQPREDFPAPRRDAVSGTTTRIPDVICVSVQNATDTLREAGFMVAVSPDRVPSRCATGAVAATDPGGQTIAGGAVRLILSSGAAAAPRSGPTAPASPVGPPPRRLVPRPRGR